jgi:hypothetical protein
MMRSWNVVCSTPGGHQFQVDISTGITAGQSWMDPNMTNNSATATATTTVSAPTAAP